MLSRLNPNRSLPIAILVILGLGVAGCAHVQQLADDFREAAEASQGSGESESPSSGPTSEAALSLDDVITDEITSGDEPQEYRIEVPADQYFAVYTSLGDSSSLSATLFIVDGSGTRRIPESDEEVGLDGSGRRGRNNFGPYEPAEEDRTFVLQVRGGGGEFVVAVLDALGESVEVGGAPLQADRESLETVKLHTFTAPAGTTFDLAFQNETGSGQDIRLTGWDAETGRATTFLTRPVSRGSGAVWSDIEAKVETTYRFMVIGEPGPYEIEARPSEAR